jgi:hypothetical protein
MEIRLPDDCGNSPRAAIVGDFAVKWAAGDSGALAEWLADDARWTLAGPAPRSESSAPVPRPPFEPQYVEVLSAVPHGRLAACDGYMIGNGSRADFCHIFRFAGAARTARIIQIRTYISDTRSLLPGPAAGAGHILPGSGRSR